MKCLISTDCVLEYLAILHATQIEVMTEVPDQLFQQTKIKSASLNGKINKERQAEQRLKKKVPLNSRIIFTILNVSHNCLSHSRVHRPYENFIIILGIVSSIPREFCAEKNNNIAHFYSIVRHFFLERKNCVCVCLVWLRIEFIWRSLARSRSAIRLLPFQVMPTHMRNVFLSIFRKYLLCYQVRLSLSARKQNTRAELAAKEKKTVPIQHDYKLIFDLTPIDWNENFCWARSCSLGGFIDIRHFFFHYSSWKKKLEGKSRLPRNSFGYDKVKQREKLDKLEKVSLFIVRDLIDFRVTPSSARKKLLLLLFSLSLSLRL